MATYILDTDTLSLYQRNHVNVLAAASRHSTDMLAVCSITLEEQIGGWSALARRARMPLEQEHASMFLAALVISWNRFAVVPMTIPAIAQFESLSKAKLNVRRNDLRIAAIVLELGATLVTRNQRDFGRVTALSIEDWSI